MHNDDFESPVIVQPANHGEGRSAEGAKGRTATEGDTSRERDRGKEVGGKELCNRNRSATTRPLHKRYAACRRYADTFILT